MWELDSEREKALAILSSVLVLDLSTLWGASSPEEEFLHLFTKIAFQVLENPLNAKNQEIRGQVFIILGNLVKRYGQSFQITMTLVNNILCKFEHAVVPLVDLMELFTTEYDNSQIVGDVLREIGKVDPGTLAKDSAAAKNISQFLPLVASRLPHIVLTSVSVFLSLLDSEVSILGGLTLV